MTLIDTDADWQRSEIERAMRRRIFELTTFATAAFATLALHAARRGRRFAG